MSNYRLPLGNEERRKQNMFEMNPKTLALLWPPPHFKARCASQHFKLAQTLQSWNFPVRIEGHQKDEEEPETDKEIP